MTSLNTFTSLIPAYPELFVLGMAFLVMLVDVHGKGPHAVAVYWVSLFTIAGAATLSLAYLGFETPLNAFGGMFVSDQLGQLLKLFAYLSVAAIFIYSRPYLKDRNLAKGEFYSLGLFALVGVMIMISANNMLVMYLGLELMSLSLYAMVALDRDSPTATEAAIKYFVLGALASGLLLYGMSMVYGATGTLSIPEIAQAMSKGTASKAILSFGLVFMVAGLAFKLGVVPFHMWVPDVYQGAPTPVTLMIGSAPKLAAFALTVRLLVVALFPLAVDWQQMFIIMAVLSLAIGNLAAIMQTNLKRMLAFSTISHMGFVLLALATGVAGGNALNAGNAYGSALFYILTYSITTLASFGIILLLSRQGFESDNIDDFKGLAARNPWFAWMTLLVMFSLAGIPPTVGFWAKYAVLQSVVGVGGVWVAVLAVVFSLIGAFYYLRVVKVMFFDEPAVSAATGESGVIVPASLRLLFGINALALLLIGLMPGWLLKLSETAIKNSLNF
jgi:NADH-quinone oxidoreductase subunit N